MARQPLSIASGHNIHPAETIDTVRVWVQQCEVLEHTKGWNNYCHFQTRLEVGTKTGKGNWPGCPSLDITEREAQVVLTE
jgi:hypothetical protein